jgi:soluble lytic murein transglycosylase-like protein
MDARWALVGALGGIAAFLFWKRADAFAFAPASSALDYTPPPTTALPSTLKPQSFETAFMAAENEYGLPSGILHSMAGIESSFQPDIIYCKILGGVGEKGIMQIDPRFHDVDGCDPWTAIPYAASYLRENYNRFGNWRLAVAAYNWGPTNLATKGYGNAPQVTQDYVARVVREVGI